MKKGIRIAGVNTKMTTQNEACFLIIYNIIKYPSITFFGIQWITDKAENPLIYNPVIHTIAPQRTLFSAIWI